MHGNEGMIKRGPGLVDLIAGKTPTYVGWTVDPTDGEDITDGDITTFCTTGNTVIGAGWQEAYFEWDLGAFYNVFVGGVGNCDATAGTGFLFPIFWNGAAWLAWGSATAGNTKKPMDAQMAMCSKVRLGLTADAAATITPNIREFNVWGL